MKFHLAWVQLALWALATAVTVENAFIRDRMRLNYGKIEKVGFGSSSTVYGLSGNGNLYQFDKDGVHNVLQIGKYGMSDIHVLPNNIVLFSPGKTDVTILDRASGATIDTVSLEHPPREFRAKGGIEILIKDQSGKNIIWTPESVDAASKSDILADITVHASNEQVRALVKSTSKTFTVDVTDVQDRELYEENGEPYLLVIGSTEQQITYHSVNLKSGEQKSFSVAVEDLSPGKAVLADFPTDPLKLDKAHLIQEAEHNPSVLLRWLLRLVGHLSALGRVCVETLKQPVSSLDFESVAHDLQGLLVVYDEVTGYLRARNSRTGEDIWQSTNSYKSHLVDIVISGENVVVVFDELWLLVEIRDGKIIGEGKFSSPPEAVMYLGEKGDVVAARFGESYQILVGQEAEEETQYISRRVGDTIQGYIAQNRELIPTWKLEEEEVLAVALNGNTPTQAVGISQHDRSVLYTFLNPNLVAVISRVSGGFKATFLDSVVGNVLLVQRHDNVTFDAESFRVTVVDNWVVYSYLVVSPKVEQRVTVVDLFTNSLLAVKGKVSILESAPRVESVTSETFVFGEKIVSMASTFTRFGITVKSILFLTESGSLVEIPKYVLNSRRIRGRKMTQQDFESDFRMMPYEPIILKDDMKVLNHGFKLQPSANTQILVHPTEYESSAVVCLTNKYNDFCTVVQPSMSFDLLGSGFDKFKLILTILALGIAAAITQPLVASRKLKNKWVD